MKYYRTHKNNRGTILVITLFVLVMISTIALEFSLSTQTGSASVRNFKESAEARQMALDAVEEAMAYLSADPDPLVDYIDEEGQLRTDPERPPLTEKKETERGKVELVLEDESARLNMRALTPQNLSVLQELLGERSEDSASDMAASLLDWIDPDELHRIGGAESDYYSPKGYTSKNRPIDVPGELELIKGFANTTAKDRLGDYITTFSSKINVNTASPLVLESIGLDSVAAASIKDMREGLKGLRSIPTTLTQPATTFTDTFRIEARASINGSPEVVHITSIVKRHEGIKGMKFRTIYWRESIEAGGA